MIKEAYCSYEVSKLLKDKGFDEPTNCYYHLKEDDYEYPDDTLLEATGNDTPDFLNSLNRHRIATPTQAMAMTWLREVHQLHISVDVTPIYGKVKDEKGKNTCGVLYWHYMASGEWMNSKYNPQQKAFVVSEKSYKEAVDAALKYALENLIMEDEQ